MVGYVYFYDSRMDNTFEYCISSYMVNCIAANLVTLVSLCMRGKTPL